MPRYDFLNYFIWPFNQVKCQLTCVFLQRFKKHLRMHLMKYKTNKKWVGVKNTKRKFMNKTRFTALCSLTHVDTQGGILPFKCISNLFSQTIKNNLDLHHLLLSKTRPKSIRTKVLRSGSRKQSKLTMVSSARVKQPLAHLQCEEKIIRFYIRFKYLEPK